MKLEMEANDILARLRRKAFSKFRSHSCDNPAVHEVTPLSPLRDTSFTKPKNLFEEHHEIQRSSSNVDEYLTSSRNKDQGTEIFSKNHILSE